jgi:hypothetical protein
MAGSPSWFGRYERDTKPALHVLFLVKDTLYFIEIQ